MFFIDYIEAHNYAVNKAREYSMTYGLESTKEFGKSGYSVKMIPTNPDKRQGFELRCEVITKDSPLYTKL